MSFVERVHTVAAARDLLGVGPDASPEALRAAWKRVAFETHPDRNGGQRAAFDNARAAYALLSGDEDAPRKPARQARPGVQRPTVSARVDRLSHEAIEACVRLLAESPRFPGAAPRSDLFALDPAAEGQAEGAKDHVPVSAEREGRDMVFVVAGALARGLNRVAIPSAEFRDRRKVVPRIVSFTSPKAGAGQVAIPDSILQRVVPGARSVRFRFTG